MTWWTVCACGRGRSVSGRPGDDRIGQVDSDDRREWNRRREDVLSNEDRWQPRDVLVVIVRHDDAVAVELLVYIGVVDRGVAMGDGRRMIGATEVHVRLLYMFFVGKPLF